MGASACRRLESSALALFLVAAALAVQPACDSTPSSEEVFTASDGTRFRTEVVVEGLEVPWSLVFAPDGRLFITERPGRVRIVEDGRLRPEPALTLTDVFTQDEAGLMGMALHPAFNANRHVYLVYTATVPGGSPVNRLVRYRESSGTLVDRIVLLDDVRGSNLHDGSRLRFGPDSRLYITMGDALNPSLAQDVASYNGKILRLDDDGTTPPGNRFSSPVYSYGHRNPQGIDWHPASGDLWSTEHGQTGNDELNLIDSGANYGWPLVEGAQTGPGLEPPVLFFTPAIAPSGASFYTGSRLPSFRNDLFVGTLRGQHVLRIRFDPADPKHVIGQERLLEGRFGRIRDVVTGPDGALYFSTSNRDGRGSPAAGDDRVVRIVAAS